MPKELTPTYAASLDPLRWSMSPSGKIIVAFIGRRAEPAGCQGAECEVFALYLQGVTTARPKRAIAEVGVGAGWSPDSRRIVHTHGGLVIEPTAEETTKTISIPSGNRSRVRHPRLGRYRSRISCAIHRRLNAAD